MGVSTTVGLQWPTLIFVALVVPGSVWASQSGNCPAEPSQKTPIVSGETYSGTNCVLRTTGDADEFRFKGSAGDTYRAVAAMTTGGYPNNVCLSLYAPGLSHTPIFSGCSNTFYGLSSVATDQKLMVNGVYTVLVTETSDSVNRYALSLEQLSPAGPDAVPLLFDKNQADEVTPPTAQDAFTFYGATTGTYEIAASISNGGYPADLCFDVFQFSGTRVIHALCTNTFYGITTIQTDMTPSQNGTYVVIVYESGNNAKIGFNLQASCLLGDCPPPPPPQCVLTDTPSYNSKFGTLTMQFKVGAAPS